MLISVYEQRLNPEKIGRAFLSIIAHNKIFSFLNFPASMDFIHRDGRRKRP